MTTKKLTNKPKKVTRMKTQPVKPARGGEKSRFYILLVLLALSIALAWLINTGMSQTLSDQFN